MGQADVLDNHHWEPQPLDEDLVRKVAAAIVKRSTWPSLHWPSIIGVQNVDVAMALARAALEAIGGPVVAPEAKVPSRSFLEVRGGPYAGDLMRWPNPADPGEVEWKLRHLGMFGQQPSSSDLVMAASFMSAYRALIALPQKARNQRIEQIKSAMHATENGENPHE